MRKRFTFFLLGVLFLLIPWVNVTAQNSVYLNEDFENVSTIPTGWNILEGTYNVTPWQLYSDTYNVTPYEGTKCMKFDSFNNSSGTYSVLKTAPVMIPTSASDVNLTFWVMNYQGGDLSVYLSTDSGTTYENNLLESGIVNVTSWTKKVYSLNQYIGQSVTIVFKATSNYGSWPANLCAQYIDNVKIYDVPTCAQPTNINFNSATQTALSFIWDVDNEGDISDTFIFTIKENDGTIAKMDTVVISNIMSHTVNGLNPNTDYNVTIKADCSANSRGYSAVSNSVAVTTLCNPSPLPYTNNFDSETDIPSCWVVNAPTTSTTVNGSVKHGTTGKSFCIQSTESTTAYITTGQFNHAANDIQIDFNVTAYSDKTPLAVGLMTDPYDLTTFEPLFNLQVNKSMQWQNIRVNTHLSNYNTTTGVCVAVQVPSGSSNIIYIDDLSITSIPSCIRPEYLEVTAIDSASISVAWDAVGNTATNYQIELTDMTDNSVVVYDKNTNPVVISNLISNNIYQVRVRTICGEADTSEWSLPQQVHTLCTTFQVPFYENFDNISDLPDCWSTYLTNEGTGWGDAYEGWQLYQSSYSGSTHSPNNALMSPDSKAGTRYLLNLPPINIPQTGDYELNFWMRRDESDRTRENITIYINNLPTLEGAVKIDSLERSLYSYPIENGGGGFYEYFYPITMRGVVYIMIESQHQLGGSIYLDDISVEPKRACRNAVNNINYVVGEPDNKAVRLSWKSRSEETSWLVSVDIYNSNSELVYQDTVLATDTAYSFDFSQQLDYATSYSLEFAVRAYCANGDTAAATTKTVYLTTACNVATLPFTEGFEDTTFPPMCWSAITDPNSAYPYNIWYRNSYDVANGNGSACFNDASDPTRGFLSTPVFNLESGNNYSFSINIRRTNSYTDKLHEGISIWLSPVQGDTTNATKLGFIPRVYNLTPAAASTGFSNYSWTITPETTGNYCFIIQARQQNGESNYVDDVQIRQLSSCLPPSTADATITPLINTVNVTVKNYNKDIEYVVCSQEDVVADSINSSDVIIRKTISASDSTFVITGLNASTTYRMYMRIICNDETNDISDWTGPYSFTTMCEAPTISGETEFVESFENFETSSYFVSSGTCYDVESTNSIYVKESIGQHLGSSGTNCVPFDGDKQIAVYYNTSGTISRLFYLQAGHNYETTIYSRMDQTLSVKQSSISLFYSPIDADTALYSVKDLDANSGEWTKFSGYFNVPVDGYYNVGFEFTQKSSYGSYMAFDYFRIREVACIPPTNVEVLATSSSSVTAQLSSLASEWEVRVCTEKPSGSDNDPAYVFVDTVTSNQFVVNGLTPNTDYYMVVRSICSETASDWTRAVQFTTDCVPYAVPYSTSFETTSELRCWRMSGSQGVMGRNTSTKKFGTSSLRVKQCNIISPELIVDSLAGFMINGWVRTAQATTIGVGIQSDPNDVSTYAFVDSIVVPTANTWMEFTVYLDEVTAADEEYVDIIDARHVVLSCNAEFYYYFDNLIISPAPTCPKPTSVNATVVDSHNVQLDIQTTGAETIWQVTAYMVSGSNEVAVKDTIVNATTVIIDGLEPITNYYFTVSAICTAGDTSFVTYSNSVKTPCAPTILPYSVNFANGMSDCWSLVTTPNSDTYWYYYGYYGYIYANKYGTSADTAYCVSPEFILNSNNGVVLSVKGYQSNTSEDVNTYLRYTTDDGATYTRVNESCLVKGANGVKTITIPNIGPGIFHFEVISEYTQANNYQYIYGFDIEEIENCIRPQNAQFDISLDSTVVTIVDTVSGHTQWDYSYDVAEFNPNERSFTSINSKTFKLTGLQSQTKYFLYVRSNCGSETSSWSTFTFTTPCDVASLPYFEGFESLNTINDVTNECYTFYSNKLGNHNYLSNVTPYITLETSVSSKYKSYASEKGIKFHSSNQYDLYLYLPKLELPVNSTVLNFKYVNEGTNTSYNSNIVVGIMLPDDESSFIPVYTCPLENTSVDHNPVTLDFTQLLTEQYDNNYRIAFRYGHVFDEYYAAIDDISVVAKVKCYNDPIVEFNNLDNNNIILNADYYADSLEVAYGVVGTVADNCNSFFTTENDITLTGLTAGTTYDIYVRNVCADAGGSWIGPMTITTECDPIAISMENPWVENFDNTDINVRFPDCMARLITYDANNVTYPLVVDTLIITPNASLAMKGDNMIALPRFIGELNSYRLSFYARGTGNVILGSVNGVDNSTFSTITTIATVAGVNKYDIDLSLYQISGNRLALQTTGTSTELYIDSLTVEIRPTCYAPRFVNVVAAGDVKAQISCQLSPITESYQYYVLTGTDTIQNVSVSGTTNLVDLVNLTSNTTYEFGIRTSCSDGATSDWTTVTFTTVNPMLTAPFLLDFEDNTYDSYITYKNHSTNIFVIGTASEAVYSGTKALYVTSNAANKDYGYNTDVTQRSYVSIPVYLERGAYNVKYNWKSRGESCCDYGRAVIVPYSKNFVAGEVMNGLSNTTIPDGCIAIDEIPLQNISNNWETASVDFVLESAMAANIVFAWFNDYSGGNQPPLAIDNFEIVKFDCIDSFDSVVVSNVEVNSFKLNVYNNPALHDSVQYVIFNNDGVVAASDIVSIADNNTILINNLSESTTYFYQVSGFCDEGASSIFSGYVHTLCNNIVVDQTTSYSEGFEGMPYNTAFAVCDPCWTVVSSSENVGLKTIPETSYDNRVANNGSNAVCMQQGANSIMYRNFAIAAGDYQFMLYASTTTPNAVVSLLIRQLGSSTWDTVKVQTVYDVYEPIVGKVTVSGGNYELGINVDTRQCIYGYALIDDVTFGAVSVYAPSELTITNIGSTTADVSWTAISDNHRLQLKNGNNVVIDSIITNSISNISLTNLVANSDYEVFVNAIAADGVTASVTLSKTFSTLCMEEYSYYNDFDQEVAMTRPNCWSFYSHKYSGEAYDLNESNQTDPHWNIYNLNGNNVLAIYPYMITSSATSVIYSPQVIINRAKTLKFDYLNQSSAADTLTVTIVANGVESAPILVATRNTTNGIWQSFTYDLSSYIGSNIRVKFRNISSFNGWQQYIAIDNFRINCEEPGAVYNVTTCSNEPYIGNGFNIPAEKLSVGQTATFTRYDYGMGGDCDTVITVNVYVQPPQTVDIYDTICEGDVYNNGKFVNLTTAGTYQQIYQSYAGCDSIVRLRLTVIPAYYSETVNLCEGDTYNFAGQTITSAGVYTDTIVRPNGCDSIVTLTVNYSAKYYEESAYFCEGTSYYWNGVPYNTPGRHENRLTNSYGCDSILVLNLEMLSTNSYVTVELCDGQTYEFFGNSITDAGTYTHTLANSLGCDSIINLTVTKVDAPINRVSDYVCEGQGYYGYGFNFTADDIVSDTVVTRTVKTTEGCDSIVELTLDFIPTVRVAITATINEGETYEFGGNTLTQAGEYEHTYHTALGCDSVVTLTLNVTTPVDNAYALPIVVAPNPVYGGQSTFVNREWTAAEQSGMRVEVLNSVGQVVEVFTPTTFPIEVGGIYTSGVYYIRVTTGTGDIYLGRLVVR